MKATTRVINEFNLDNSYFPAVKKNLNPILLCILCLLHDCKLIFHDNHVGTCFLSLYPRDNKSLNEKPDNNSLIALVSDDIKIRMPIFISNIKVGEHLPSEELPFNNLNYMERISWINAKRDETNKLILTS